MAEGCLKNFSKYQEILLCVNIISIFSHTAIPNPDISHKKKEKGWEEREKKGANYNIWMPDDAMVVMGSSGYMYIKSSGGLHITWQGCP